MDCILPEYRLSKEKYRELWDNCIFVLDTNVLFNLYRYSPGLREGLIETFNKISNRIWIPHQVALEYYDNKPKVISEEINKYKTITDIISKCPQDIKGEIAKKDLSRKHTATSEITKELIEKIDESFRKINDDLEDIINKYPKRKDFELIDETICELLVGKVGKPYSVEVLEQICRNGITRYELMLPPGYEDKKAKEGIRKYGDLILWFQIIDMAKERKKPVILICEDLKDDWWWNPSNTNLGPRPELIQEFTSKTNVLFYIYSLDEFMRYAKEYINAKIEENIIEEAKEYRAEEEERLKETEVSKEIASTIESAEAIFNLGSCSGAGVTAGRAIELHLRKLCGINKVPYKDTDTISSLAHALKQAGMIDDTELTRLIYLGNVRNKCAHSNDIISKDQVKALIEQVKKIVIQ